MLKTTQEIAKIPSQCFIGIGSNLNDPFAQVNSALDALKILPQCRFISSSALYRSEPVGPAGQDDYINAVALIESTLAPENLLEQLQKIENDHQRVRIERWGARTLDLDILLIDNQHIDTERLQVPHPFMKDRNFVLVPLAELAPNIQITGQHIAELIDKCPTGDLEKL